MENGREYTVSKCLQLLDCAAREILDGLVSAQATDKQVLAPSGKGLELPLVWD